MVITTEELLNRYRQGERDFSALKLCGLDLSYLNFQGINLSKSDLRGANLSHTNLTRSVLCNASLLEANLEGANLKGADLTGAIYNLYAEGWIIWIGLPDNPEPQDCLGDLVATVFPEGLDPEKAGLYCINNSESLEKIDLANFSLNGIEFIRINLKGANLKGADLSFSDLSYSLLEDANLENTNLEWTCLTSANLKNTNLNGANIINTFLDGADLSGCNFSNANIQSIISLYNWAASPTLYDERTKFPNGFRPRYYDFKKVRIISPGWEDLDFLRTPLNYGEKQVLNFFDENLSEEWEIYVQPHLNGLRPDFVLLNPNIGIAVFEVKDWNLNAMPYRVKQIDDETPQLWATSKDGIDFRVKDNPIEKIALYKENIANLYCPQIDILNTENTANYYNLITAGVIMTSTTTQIARDLFKPFLRKKGFLGSLQTYYPVVGFDAVLEDVFPASVLKDDETAGLMTPEIAKSLRSWLVEPDFAVTQRQPLELNKKQRVLVTTRTSSGNRRIKGSAGSGKSLVIAARAAQLSSEDKEVLVVTYNITLWHYLRDLAVRYPVENKRIKDNITWLHFHEWCKLVICKQAGLDDEYNALWQGNPDISKVLEIDIVNLVNTAVETGGDSIQKYDAILIDEGQDYNINWWNALRRVLQPGGEMVLAVDETQDIYERAIHWTGRGNNAGFSGPWLSLNTSYRTPPSLIKYLRDFSQRYLEGMVNLPQSENEEDKWTAHLSWIQITMQNSLVDNLIQEILNIPDLANPNIVAYPDIVLLVPTHRIGLSCVQILNKKNIKVIHVFDHRKQDQKSRKLAFFMGDARLKACTIHSFKGWEGRYIVVGINAQNKKSDLAAIYVALSRLKRHTEGSYLIVICSDPNLEEFGRTWPTFEKR
jgi:uncharacterized protein YjbI with pentapeptide repeats